MTITRTFKLCLNAGAGIAPYINVNQYDSGEQWVFELYQENGSKYIPSTGAIIGLKADGNAIANNGTVDSEGRVVITETEQMTAAAGRSVFELSIDGNTHGTANFIVKAERKPTDDAQFSDSDLSMFQTVIDASEVIEEIIGEGGDPSQRITDAVEDWLEAHPEATTTVQDGAITAPKINTSLWDKLLVSESASGSVASFDDGADGVPVKSLVAHINPVQSGSGDPSPTNVRPISGHTSATVTRTGKNLLGGLVTTTGTQNGVTYTANADGTYTVNGTNSASGASSDYRIGEQGTYRLDLPVGDYKLSGGVQGLNGSGNTLYLGIRRESTRYVGNNGTSDSDFSIAEGEYISSVFIRMASGATASNAVFKPMIRFASDTDDTFAPYTGNTYTIDLNGTVYGGTLDVVTGVLTVTHGIVTDFSALASDGTSSTGAYRYKLAVAGVASYTNGDAKCNMLNFKARFNADAGEFYNGINEFKIFLTDSTVASAITTLTGCQIVYPLATPQTIQLTPQEVTSLLGENNITADTGEVEVIYRADTKMYIDEQTKATKKIIAGVETSFTATKNYTVGNLLIVGDDLYRVTANIANGGTITVNTNVVQTTVAEQLLALA